MIWVLEKAKHLGSAAATYSLSYREVARALSLSGG